MTERCREFRYRFAQALIFGLPVLALQWFGPLLSGRADEASRWVPLLQAILTGWICYIGALPMLVEGLVLLRNGLSADFVVTATAAGAYLFSLISVLGIFFGRGPFYRPLLFPAVVIVLIAWNGLRWASLRSKSLGS